MVPKAKKNLHACLYHLNNLLNSKHFEEVEINFGAFVNSARNITYVLQKEFKKSKEFIDWYGNPDDSDNAPKDTKLYEMKNDELCKFFNILRSKIIKEGINNLQCSIAISRMNNKLDFPDSPSNSTLVIGNKGIYYHICKGTKKEDYIPAVSKTAKINTNIEIVGAPKKHLGIEIKNPNLLVLVEIYYGYLENLIEEWTEIINK